MSTLMATEIEIVETNQSVILHSGTRPIVKESHDEKGFPARLESRKTSFSDHDLNDGRDSASFALLASKLQIWPRIIKLKDFDEKAIKPLTWKRFNDLNKPFFKPLYEHLAKS
jgi:hypothetical protein